MSVMKFVTNRVNVLLVSLVNFDHALVGKQAINWNVLWLLQLAATRVGSH